MSWAVILFHLIFLHLCTYWVSSFFLFLLCWNNMSNFWRITMYKNLLYYVYSEPLTEHTSLLLSSLSSFSDSFCILLFLSFVLTCSSLQDILFYHIYNTSLSFFLSLAFYNLLLYIHILQLKYLDFPSLL